jgi:outer membrane protein insertion porin family
MIPKRALFLFFIFSFLMITADGFSQAEVYKIRNISTKGNKLYDEKTIIAYSGLKPGMEISIPSDEIRESITKLWNMNIFSDIQIYVDKKVGSDVFLVIAVQELPRIESIEIVGNDNISKSDIESKVPLVAGQVLSEQRLKDIQNNLEKYYAEEGYSQAEISVDKLISANNEARIRIKITEGNKVVVRSINFSGNNNIKSKKLRGEMETSEKVWWKFWNRAHFDKQKFEEDKKTIIDYYKEFGFKDAEIVSANTVLSPDKEDMFIDIKISEGTKFYIDSIDFVGNKLYPDSLLIQRLNMKKGDVYNQKKLNQNLYSNEAESDIYSLYMDNGYLGFNADVKEKVVGKNKVSLTIEFTENRQYRIGSVSFEGNEKTQDKVLRREMYTIPGEYFARSNVKRSLQQLNSLNYFNPEKLNQDITLENDSTVNVKYIVSERSSDQFNASVGYAGTYGVTGAIGLTFNNFDITRPFSGGGGQILNFSWQFGEAGTYRTFNIGFTEPWLYNTPTLFGFNLFDTRENYYYDVRESGGILSIGRRFRWPDDYFRGDWSIKFQRTNVINGADYYQEGLRTQFSLKQTISRSTVYDPIFPLEGTKISNTTELSGGPFLPGNIDFIKNIFMAELYTPVIRNTKFVLYTNFNFYVVNSISSDKYLPPTELFFMGGNGLAYNTIALRGYDDRNIGPKNSSYNPIGGRVALKYSAELRFPLSLDPVPIFLLTFVEAGNVWADISKTDPFDLRRAVGFGTRIQLPAVGLVGFDFGYGFDRKIEDRQDPKFIFHFQFGRGF